MLLGSTVLMLAVAAAAAAAPAAPPELAILTKAKVTSHSDGGFNDSMQANVAVGVKFNDSTVGIKCGLCGSMR